MARSKAQLKAQQQALHTQTQPNSGFQMKRLHPPGVRPTAPPALFQLGRPTTGAPAVIAAGPVVLKHGPIQTPILSGNSSGQAIDLTLDEEEEDEPINQQPGASDSALTVAASDDVKLSMLDGINNKASAEKSVQLTRSTSDLMAPLVEDVESDVDEDFPIMPQSASASERPVIPLPTSSVEALSVTSTQKVLASHNNTKEDVGAALDAFSTIAQMDPDGQDRGDVERHALVEDTAVYGDEFHDMEVDVDEELPNQAPKSGEESSKTTGRLVEVENLEDGEIFEEGAPPKPTIQVQQAMIRENRSRHFDAPTVDTMGIRPHLRNKKQKKRGKKKTKRKLEAMQLLHTPPGEMLPEFERSTRQRPFANAQPPGQYTMAMMRNGPRGAPMDMRPVYQDPPPAPFRPSSLLVGGPIMRPPPLPLRTPPLPPPSYDDSQILRVNRQGSMEMLDSGAELSLHTRISEPPMHGGFKYRSVSMSPPRLVASGQSHPLQRSVSDTSRLPPIPSSGYCDTSNSVASKEGDDSEEVDLDSLRAAALRSKTKRPPKTSMPTPSKTTTVPAVPVIHSSSSSSLAISPGPSPIEERHSEPTSPEIDELRLEILRSMTRNRKRTTVNAINTDQVSTPPVSEAYAIELPNQNSGCEKPADGDDKIVSEIPANSDSSTAHELPGPVLPNIVQGDITVSDGSSYKRDKSAIVSEQTDVGEKAKPALAKAMGSVKLSVVPAVTTPEFRPLTACSQSLVIRLSPEDFSPRKSGDAARMKSTASSSLHDAIKEMRRKIAEREKEQTNRLLDNTAARLSKQSSGSSSSPESSSSTTLQLFPGRKVSNVAAHESGATTISPEVSSSTTKIRKEPGGSPPKATTVDELMSKRGSDDTNSQVKGSEGKERSIEPESESFSAVEPAPGEKPALKTKKRNDTSADIQTLTYDDVRPEQPCDVPAIRKPSSIRGDVSIPGNDNEEHNFDEIRAEYEQCVAECKEADIHIARLSNEIAQLEKQLPPVG